MSFFKSPLLFLFYLPLAAQQLTSVSGNGQWVFEQFPAAAPFVVKVTNASGAPVTNVPVTWSFSQGQGTIRTTPSGSCTEERTSCTGADGTATAQFIATSIQPSASWDAATVTATSSFGSASFFITTIQSRVASGPAGQPAVQLINVKDTLSGPANSTIPSAFTVVVTASAGFRLGQGIPNIGVRIVLSPDVDPSISPAGVCDAPGGLVLTDSRGYATCNLVLNGITGLGGIFALVGESQRTVGFPLTITAASACQFSVAPTSQSIAGVGGSGSFAVTAGTCSWSATTAAAWISLQNATGTGNGIVNYTVAPNTGAARTAVITVGTTTFTVSQAAQGAAAALSITSGLTLPGGSAGLSYSYPFAASGGQQPYTWSATNVPAGLTLNSGTGVLSGTPTSPGSYSIAVTVRDAAGTTANQTFSLSVGQNPSGGGGTLAFITTSFLSGTVGSPYQQTIGISGGCPNPFAGPRVELASGTLPPGLAFQSTAAGVAIAGTPSSGGAYPFVLRLADPCGNATTQSFTITIGGNTAPSAQLSVSTQSLTFAWQRGGPPAQDQTVSVTSGSTSTSFTVSAVSNGNWLSVSASSLTTPATLTVHTTGYADFAPGTYPGTITISSPSQTTPLAISVTLSVTATGPFLSVTPSSLTFSSSPAAPPTPQTLALIATGTFNYTATPSVPWLTVSPATGTAPTNLLVTVNPAGLAAGNYNGSILLALSGAGQTATVPVTLTVTGNPSAAVPQVISVVNGANFLPGGIAPGEIVSVFGTGLGPDTLANYRLTADNGLDTLLSGIRLLFDDQPAPLLFVSGTQIAAVVPYTISGRATVSVQVDNAGVRSQALAVPVADSAPGIFTSGGSQQAAALNQDASLNTSNNGAVPGSVVVLYATGEGLTNPPGVAGRVVPSGALARPNLPVRVTIGGQEAEVVYAGSAPGQVAGLMQVNARVPAGVSRGTAVQVVVIVGNVRSQETATLFIAP